MIMPIGDKDVDIVRTKVMLEGGAQGHSKMKPIAQKSTHNTTKSA